MSQVKGTFNRTVKELVRERVVVFWTVAFPVMFLFMANIVFMSGISDYAAPHVRAMFTVAMSVYAVMIAGMVDLPGKIADDREKGMLLKLKSMPVKPWFDFAGRMFGFLVFGSIAITMVLVVGLLMGAQFQTTGIAILQSVGYFLLVVLASSGIGLIIGTVIRRGESALYTGIALAIVTSFMSGIFTVYSQLPSYLQGFSRIYPISSCNAGVEALLVGEQWVGYNPFEAGQVLLTAVLSIMLFVVGSVLHSRYGWRRD